MKLSEIASLFELSCKENIVISGVSTDSRQIKPGQLFVAIRGEHFDGHDYHLDVERMGAAAIICERSIDGVKIPQLIVPNTLHALALIATAHRDKQSAKVIALTGSNGKTSVKEMIACILPEPSFATLGNLNNHIGAPLSVLALQPEHRFAVFELGANHIGEIAHTVAIVKPHVTLINNIAPAHIAGFGSLDGTARAKGEIHQGLLPEGTAIVNDDDDYAHFWDPLLTAHRVLRFSTRKKASIYARDVTLGADGCAQFTLVIPSGEEARVSLQVPGIHSVSNALAAAAATYALGISLSEIIAGLSQFRGVKGRMAFIDGKNKAIIIDDTYNANLRSVLTAIEVLAMRKGTRILVLGDMGELGQWGAEHHQQIGIAARDHGINAVMTCGKLSQSTSLAFGADGTHYESQSSLVQDLLKHMDKDTTVLVKGSRSAAMEKIVNELKL